MPTREQFVADYSAHKMSYSEARPLALSNPTAPTDCSGSIIKGVYRLFGQTAANALGGTGGYTGTMCKAGKSISANQLQPGDLIFCDWGSNGVTSTWDHVCVYAGNNQVWNHGGVPNVGPVLYPITRETGAAIRVLYMSIDNIVHFSGSPAPSQPVSGEYVEDGKISTPTSLMVAGLQRYYKTTVDGKISTPTSQLVTAMQKDAGTPVDGKISTPTSLMVCAWQRAMGTPVDGKISTPVSSVVKATQRALNMGTWKGI